MVDHLNQDYCGVRRFDSETERVRIFVARHFSNRVYRSEILSSKSKGLLNSIISEDEWAIIVNGIDYQVKLYKDKEKELIEAAQQGDITKIQELKKAGYPIDIRSKEGWDILIIACFYGQLALVKFLVEEEGWNINTSNYKGTTALMYAMTAVSKNDADIEILSCLADKADWSLRDVRGNDIFYYAVEYNNDKVLQFIDAYRSPMEE